MSALCFGTMPARLGSRAPTEKRASGPAREKPGPNPPTPDLTNGSVFSLLRWRCRCRRWCRCGRRGRFGARRCGGLGSPAHNAVVPAGLAELAAMPIALNHAKRDDGDQYDENQAHVLVPPLVGRKLAQCGQNRKGRSKVNWRNSEGPLTCKRHEYRRARRHNCGPRHDLWP